MPDTHLNSSKPPISAGRLRRSRFRIASCPQDGVYPGYPEGPRVLAAFRRHLCHQAMDLTLLRPPLDSCRLLAGLWATRRPRWVWSRFWRRCTRALPRGSIRSAIDYQRRVLAVDLGAPVTVSTSASPTNVGGPRCWYYYAPVQQRQSA
jgi:hypothetical protein